MRELLPISVIIPTGDRPEILQRTLSSLEQQHSWPREILINDASSTQTFAAQDTSKLAPFTRVMTAQVRGAAAQRNEAFAHATQPYILFMDDDVLLEPDCLPRLWAALQDEPRLGGMNAMITNQSYQTPGLLGRALYWFLGARGGRGNGGRWLGAVLNFLPEDRADLPEVVPTEWLNTTCALYRREALPNPLFPPWFYGYSLGEDLMLSLEVQKRGWKVANARTARLFHDSQGGAHKSSQARLVAMEIYNNWRIGRAYSGLSKIRLTANFAAVQFVKLLGSVSRPSQWGMFLARLSGNAQGWWRIITGEASSSS